MGSHRPRCDRSCRNDCSTWPSSLDSPGARRHMGRLQLDAKAVTSRRHHRSRGRDPAAYSVGDWLPGLAASIRRGSTRPSRSAHACAHLQFRHYHGDTAATLRLRRETPPAFHARSAAISRAERATRPRHLGLSRAVLSFTRPEFQLHLGRPRALYRRQPARAATRQRSLGWTSCPAELRVPPLPMNSVSRFFTMVAVIASFSLAHAQQPVAKPDASAATEKRDTNGAFRKMHDSFLARGKQG